MIFLKKIYYCLIVINIILLIVGYKKMKAPYYSFLFLLPIVLITQVVGDLSKVYHYNRYPAFHLYIPAELVLLSFYYYQILKRENNKRLVLICCLLYAVVTVFIYIRSPYLFFSSGFFDFVILSVIVIILTIIYFVEEIRDENEYIFHEQPAFWINIGHLLFYPGCLLVMGFNNYLENHYPAISSKVMYINNCLNLLLYSLYIKGFICILKAKKY